VRGARESASVQSEVLAHDCACGVRGDDLMPEISGGSEPPNLRKPVSEMVGEMCPYPAPATHEGPAKQGLFSTGGQARGRTFYLSFYPLHLLKLRVSRFSLQLGNGVALTLAQPACTGLYI
jgi:hypothetical protein